MIIPLGTKRDIYWIITLITTIIIAIVSTIISLTHGIHEVFPFLYLLPIIVFVYFQPDRGVLFSLGMSSTYLVLIYYFSNFDPHMVAVSTAWFVIFVTIGVVTSSFAQGLREEEKKYQGIFENSQAGIFTFDQNSQKIIEMNRKCARMLKFERNELVGKDLSRILVDSAENSTFLHQIKNAGETGDHELLFSRQDHAIRQFIVSASVTSANLVVCSAIDITERKLAEEVITKARDDLERRVEERTAELMRANEELNSEICERQRFEVAIQLANRKLNTLSSVTRHDILNQITAIVMYQSLAEEVVKDPVALEYLKKIDQITTLIQKQIQFTRDYQHIGSRAPGWQNVSATVDTAITGIDTQALRIEKDTGDLEIFADCLFPKVFTNLVDNTQRHGERATGVRFSYRLEGDDLVLVCDDDGVGIPQSAKKQIFKREYFRSTGYGLFLTQEILSITGLSIQETGEPGAGARFEIRVPKGTYRFCKKGSSTH